MDKKFTSELADLIARLIKEQFEMNFIHWFNRGFNEVIIPALEAMQKDLVSKEDLKQFDLKIDERISNLERKVDHILENQLKDRDLLRSHESKFKRIELGKVA